MSVFLKLTKSGIVWFVLLTAFIGFALAASEGSRVWDNATLVLMIVGLYLVSSGSFMLNQAQEWRLDSKMNRTQGRPIPKGQVQPWQAYVLAVVLMGVGTLFLEIVRPQSAYLALATVILYNGLYTLYWKKSWSFGAVPGAIPGAMPVVIGYSAAGGDILTPEAAYLFMIMFLWQMPHFWCLAIRYRDDYAQGGVPVLPLKIGVDRTLYHMGLYVLTYVGLAAAAPWFFTSHVFYVLLVLPLSAKVLIEFFRYFRERGEGRWLPFFLWTNVSMLAFIGAPVMDRWLYLWLRGGL